jgi:hypothetical protein
LFSCFILRYFSSSGFFNILSKYLFQKKWMKC